MPPSECELRGPREFPVQPIEPGHADAWASTGSMLWCPRGAELHGYPAEIESGCDSFLAEEPLYRLEIDGQALWDLVWPSEGQIAEIALTFHDDGKPASVRIDFEQGFIASDAGAFRIQEGDELLDHVVFGESADGQSCACECEKDCGPQTVVWDEQVLEIGDVIPVSGVSAGTVVDLRLAEAYRHEQGCEAEFLWTFIGPTAESQ